MNDPYKPVLTVLPLKQNTQAATKGGIKYGERENTEDEEKQQDVDDQGLESNYHPTTSIR